MPAGEPGAGLGEDLGLGAFTCTKHMSIYTEYTFPIRETYFQGKRQIKKLYIDNLDMYHPAVSKE